MLKKIPSQARLTIGSLPGAHKSKPGIIEAYTVLRVPTAQHST
jgi:hypothetical protein